MPNRLPTSKMLFSDQQQNLSLFNLEKTYKNRPNSRLSLLNNPSYLFTVK